MTSELINLVFFNFVSLVSSHHRLIIVAFCLLCTTYYILHSTGWTHVCVPFKEGPFKYWSNFPEFDFYMLYNRDTFNVIMTNITLIINRHRQKITQRDRIGCFQFFMKTVALMVKMYKNQSCEKFCPGRSRNSLDLLLIIRHDNYFLARRTEIVVPIEL